MLARCYISDNAHLPDAEFKQIVAGMRRLKPACYQLATASAANNIASMQAIDKAVLQLVKDCGKKLTKPIRTNNDMPPPGPGVPPAQLIVNPILLPLNALPQCQWSIATAVPNAGPVGQNAPQANAAGPAQNIPAPRRIPKRRTILHPQARQIPNLRRILHPPANPQNNPRPPGPANPQPRIVLRLGNLHKQKDPHPPANLPGQNNPPGAANLPRQDNPPGAVNLPGQNNPPGVANLQGPINPPGLVNIPAQNQASHPMGILGTPLGMQHAPVNLQGQINPPGPLNIPAQDEAAHPMGILGTQLGMQHALANLQGPINSPGLVNIPAQDEAAHPMGILGTPLGMQHSPANLQGQINPPGLVNIPVQDKAAPPMGILGTPLGMQHAPPADIQGAAALMKKDPGFEYLGMARRVPRAVSDRSQISEFFRNILYVFFFTY